MVKLDDQAQSGHENAKDTRQGEEQPQKPRKPRASKDLSQLTQLSDFEQSIEDLEVPPPTQQQKGFAWGGWFFGALAALLSLGVGLALDQLVRELFDRQVWLGWVGAALTLIVAIAALAIVLREIWGISRLNTITALRKRAGEVQAGEHSRNVDQIIRDLDSIFSQRPDLTHSRGEFQSQRTNILDAGDLLALYETLYLGPLDKQAKALVMQSAKRVSLVTAISPRAIVDIAYVLMENTRLIRQISQLYGGRAGAIGFWRLTRNVLGHLAVTGAIAAGDSLIQQFVGHGLAARVSTKLGEGVVNGLLTARIGISAMDQARPMEFSSLKRPGISEVFKQLSHPDSK